MRLSGMLVCLLLIGCGQPTPAQQCLDFSDAICSTLDRCYYPAYQDCMDFYTEDCSDVTSVRGSAAQCAIDIRYSNATCEDEYVPKSCSNVAFLKEGL